eukprot:NODE_239_length_1950_cov_226.777486_g189_i0.p1 GENE.NODE_239_length_1950_cov_226.777486_g189_i0~~NODE_239_length_1950_cov_226.777486_g189_i0.p1  ORF type:complete len:468 (+),score=125.05 NODE_239_length_1950_cov_226.777486_g189_i0:511-1914(+)
MLPVGVSGIGMVPFPATSSLPTDLCLQPPPPPPCSSSSPSFQSDALSRLLLELSPDHSSTGPPPPPPPLLFSDLPTPDLDVISTMHLPGNSAAHSAATTSPSLQSLMSDHVTQHQGLSSFPENNRSKRPASAAELPSEKLECKRAKGRLASSRCREKQRNYVKLLEDRIQRLTAQNSLLSSQVVSLLHENQNLRIQVVGLLYPSKGSGINAPSLPSPPPTTAPSPPVVRRAPKVVSTFAFLLMALTLVWAVPLPLTDHSGLLSAAAVQEDPTSRVIATHSRHRTSTSRRLLQSLPTATLGLEDDFPLPRPPHHRGPRIENARGVKVASLSTATAEDSAVRNNSNLHTDSHTGLSTIDDHALFWFYPTSPSVAVQANKQRGGGGANSTQKMMDDAGFMNALQPGPVPDLPLLQDLQNCQRHLSATNSTEGLPYISLMSRFRSGEIALRHDIAKTVLNKVKKMCGKFAN